MNSRQIRLYVTGVFLFKAFSGCAQVEDRPVQLNQEGFYPGARKVAVVRGEGTGDHFFVIPEGKKDTVFRGRLSTSRFSAFSNLSVRKGDFSSFQKPGRYVIVVPGAGQSYPFHVQQNVHKKSAIALLKGFYYQRVSMPLEQRFAGKWHRPAGHADNAVYIHPSAAGPGRPAGTAVASPGGWYDAGDYNKYIVNSGITMGTFLSAWEDFPAYFRTLKTGIPESNNQLPDILDEALYNLRWMLTMQDPNDGGVYHKCTNADFDGMVMPGVTTAPRYLVQKSTAAALDFTAVMAQAARVYAPFEKVLPGLSDSCLDAALAAWKWAVRHPGILYNQRDINTKFQPSITTGEYGDRNLGDEWLWAAAELFVTTKEKLFFDSVYRHMNDPVVLPSWASVGTLGYYTLLRFSKRLPSYAGPVIKIMRDSVIAKADTMLASLQRNAYGVVMGMSIRDFVWGSNAVAANQGILLLNAYRQSNNKKYVDAALQNVDYLLGRNATGYCFITGIGERYPMHPHHRPSEADGIKEPVPGLLAGGPNPGMQDKCNYTFTDPERAYTDDVCSYASNEIAINWNAPAVYLLHSIEALQHEVGYAGRVSSK